MVRPTNFQIREQATDPALELSVTGELDMNTVELLAHHVERNLEDGLSALRLDLAGLGFMDSSGLRFLIELYDRSRRDGWELKIIRPRSEAAVMVLRATGADTQLPFEPNGSS